MVNHEKSNLARARMGQQTHLERASPGLVAYVVGARVGKLRGLDILRSGFVECQTEPVARQRGRVGDASQRVEDDGLQLVWMSTKVMTHRVEEALVVQARYRHVGHTLGAHERRCSSDGSRRPGRIASAKGNIRARNGSCSRLRNSRLSRSSGSSSSGNSSSRFSFSELQVVGCVG